MENSHSYQLLPKIEGEAKSQIDLDEQAGGFLQVIIPTHGKHRRAKKVGIRS